MAGNWAGRLHRWSDSCAAIRWPPGPRGVSPTTLQRWRRQFPGDGEGMDGRQGRRRPLCHRLTDEKRQRILLSCNLWSRRLLARDEAHREDPNISADLVGRACLRTWISLKCCQPLIHCRPLDDRPDDPRHPFLSQEQANEM
ncbi:MULTISPECIES: helix-turn-helix domain-containing protein [unclassified Cyanobium]|uniref:helix-turn-helix domain-containing protein n=1 Tax=unclassified Cyanobium TaxID=2627006 RepID=UPI0020CD9D1E|nr:MULTISPECIES: helix-turn-helix domain-containing protein [unclassified Cyanobium]MCP9861222.1 helix-turn-helix domain-containing protein [Cyanobium sp. Cruz-8H5]MCP9868471.1 helix-turn-helix domain-containing protein [Cyanobium sp. Cruz-8D1]